MTDPQTILDDAHRTASEALESRQVYASTLEAIAQGDPPPDASERIAQAIRELAETGRRITPADTKQHLGFYLTVYERQSEVDRAREAMEEHRNLDEIRAEVDRLDAEIKQATEELPQQEAKRAAIEQLNAAALADRAAFDAKLRLDDAKQKTRALLYELRPLDVRVSPQR